jgi:hypothetical protein
MHDFMASISDLENIAKERLQKNGSANCERLNELSQLIQYGVCTCHCHFSTSVYHSAVPCCGNAKLKATV